ncbi:SorU family sulfite dehydrogenase c-type cytochrome subunit [Pelomicrobium sp. G1]|uniref:SorU family sulfite dehydrogenase c-type cytochrome subunit n=1 Tax=unclassified Pelomicrobium TaxID=2815318 RepID=UPI003F76BCA8
MKSPLAFRKRFFLAAAESACALALLTAAAPAGANGNDPKLQAKMALGKKVFTQLAQPPCAVCHTLKDAGSSAEIGPKLDELKPDAQRVATAVRNGLGIMPAYGGVLTEEQIEALADYVARASGASK